MPLTATVNGEQVIATAVRAEHWAALKGREPWPELVCGNRGFAKTSRLGTQFFQHAPGSHGCTHKGESANHLRVKAAIVEAASAAGWSARAEVPADDRSWVADVLVERDGRRVAFEVQLSPQTAAEYHHRQTRYESEGIECYWLTGRSRPTDLAGVPALRINITDDSLTVSSHQRSKETAPLEVFIGAVLDGDLRWSPEQGAPLTGSIRWGVHTCTNCSSDCLVWIVAARAEVTCERCAYRRERQQLPPGLPPRKVATAVGLALNPALRTGLASNGLPAFTCPACHNGLPPRDMWWLNNPDAPVHTTSALGTIGTAAAHWCAPGYDLTTDTTVRYLAGDAPRAEPRPSADPRTGADLTAEAHRRRQAHEQREQAREDAIQLEQTRQMWLRHRLQEWTERRESLLADVRTMPAASTEDATTAHDRTAAIHAYMTLHPGLPFGAVRDQFPLYQSRCICDDCEAIEAAYPRDGRRILWPEWLPVEQPRTSKT